MSQRIAELLGKDAESLLSHKAKVASSLLHLPGPDFVDRVFALSDRPGDYKLVRKGEFLRCPWHGWEFDIRTGQSWCDPKTTRVRAYDASVEKGAELVKGPYVAETFKVSVEQNYVVVEI